MSATIDVRPLQEVPLRVLSVEDEPETLEGPLDSLKYDGHDVTCVMDADRAALALRQDRYDLLILDQRIPSQHHPDYEAGAALVRDLKSGAFGERNRDVAFVFVTGSRQWVDVPQVERLDGYIDVLLKAGNLTDDLRRCLARLSGRQAAALQRARQARMTVRIAGVPEFGGDVIQVRDQSLRLMTRCAPGDRLELPPGLYLVSARLPSGQEVLEPVHVEAGVHLELTLGTPAFVPEVARSAGPPGIELRLLRSRDAQPIESSGVVMLATATESGDVAIRVDVDDVVLAQLAMPGAEPFNVALPAARTSATQSARVRIWRDDSGLRAAAAPHGDPGAEALAGYIVSGALREAGALAAARLKRSRIEDPIEAILVGCALLRAGYPDADTQWADEMAERYDWLPDAAIVAGEVAARRGDGERAAAWFAEATERGLPILADALSMLLARLRRAGSTAPTASRLLALAARVDFTQLTVGFPETATSTTSTGG